MNKAAIQDLPTSRVNKGKYTKKTRQSKKVFKRSKNCEINIKVRYTHYKINQGRYHASYLGYTFSSHISTQHNLFI